MKKASLYNLLISVGISLATVSCNSSTTAPTATSPSAPASPAASASPTPSATPSASPTSAAPASPSPSAKPSEPTTSTNKPKETVPDTVRVAVINNSGKALKAIYMAAPSKQDWGPNELEAPIPDREKADFEWKRSDFKGADAGCVFEVRAEYADGKSAELEPIDLCKTPVINLK